jgi:hypothetical protein
MPGFFCARGLPHASVSVPAGRGAGSRQRLLDGKSTPGRLPPTSLRNGAFLTSSVQFRGPFPASDRTGSYVFPHARQRSIHSPGPWRIARPHGRHPRPETLPMAAIAHTDARNRRPERVFPCWFLVFPMPPRDSPIQENAWAGSKKRESIPDRRQLERKTAQQSRKAVNPSGNGVFPAGEAPFRYRKAAVPSGKNVFLLGKSRF